MASRQSTCLSIECNHAFAFYEENATGESHQNNPANLIFLKQKEKITNEMVLRPLRVLIRIINFMTIKHYLKIYKTIYFFHIYIYI